MSAERRVQDKPFAEACVRNRGPILDVLREALAGATRVLEVGSGTGQHAVWFAARLPQLVWQTSELPARHAGLRAWLDEAGLPNLPPPLTLDLAGAWPAARYDAVFTANTLHIVAWPLVERLFAGAARVLAPGGCFAVYGPFNYGGAYTAPGNAAFDQALRARDAASGIRDSAEVCALAARCGFRLERDVAMPADNRTLLWRRLSVGAR